MSIASLQLERYRLVSLSIEFNDAWLGSDAETAPEEEYRTTPDFDVFEAASEAQGYLVQFSIECVPLHEGTEHCRFTKVAAAVCGIFTLADDTEEETKRDLIGYNSVAMLHGIVRGLLIGATGGCVGGPFILPALNYIEMFEEKEHQAQVDEAVTPD